MKTLKPQILKGVHYREIETQLRRIFYAIIFRPVSDTLRKYTSQPTDARKTLINATDSALRQALRQGLVQYQDGVFSGEFTAAIGRDLRAIGATFDKRAKVYRLPESRVPSWVKIQSAQSQAEAAEGHRMVRQTLDDILRDLDRAVDVHTVDPADTIESIEDDFNRIAGDLVVQTRLSPESTARLSEDYSDNMKLWIKNFSKKTIGDLRETVETNAKQGYRFDKLIKGIKSRYGVTTSKAKFLARQETALFMSKYRKERFGEIGIKKYQWATSHDAWVRPAAGANPAHGDHRHLDGKVFAYANPPIVATSPRVRRANPGEDFSCRCLDRPVIEWEAS